MEAIGDADAVADFDEVYAELLFVEPDGGQPTVHFRKPSEIDEERTRGTFARVRVPVRNGRRLGRDTSLDREGFVFARHDSQVRDFYDDAELRRVYYPEMEALLKALTGASRVIVFDHTVRGSTPGARGGVEVELPSDMMHCDFTTAAAIETLRQVVPPEEADAMLKRRVVQLNVWRPITGPLTTMPLAVCDGSSIKPESCVETPLVRPDFSSEFTTLVHDPGQRWTYLPRMQPDEVMVLKNYDTDPAACPFAVHGAFVEPDVPADPLPRESIEIRAYVAY